MKTIDYRTVAGFVLLAICTAAQARETPVPQKVSFDITAPSMVQALIQFTEQSGLQLVVPTDGTTDLPARKVVGDYTPSAALEQLLAGTTLRYEFANPKTVSIWTAYAPTAAATTYSEERVSTYPTDVRVADISPTEASSIGVQRSDLVSRDGDSGEKKVIPEVLIKGSHSLNMDVRRTRDDIQPYQIFDRAAIESSGATNINDFMRTHLTVSTNADNPAQSTSSLGNSSSINLRGLGSGQTLILIDGHRVAGTAVSGNPQQPDLNGIPLSSIERIEVLPATASGIYGGGATGGVINIVLRRDYTGVEGKVTYGGSFDGGATSRRIDLSAGTDLFDGRTSLLFSGSYSEADPLLTGDRDLLERSRQVILQNNPNALLKSSVPPLGRTTNICSATITAGFGSCNTTPLTLKNGTALNSSITSVPVGYGGIASDKGAALISGAGKYNLDLANTAQASGGGGSALLTSPKVESATATLRHQFSERLSGFLELGASNNTSSFVLNAASSSFTLPSTSSANPFNQPIYVTTPAYGVVDALESSNYRRRGVTGLTFQLSEAWQVEADYTWDRTRYSFMIPTGLTTAAQSAVTTGALNILNDSDALRADFSPFVAQPSVTFPTHGLLQDTALRAAGSLWDLPGGTITIAALAEHRRESFDDIYQSTATSSLRFPARSQNIDSVYLETGVPILSAVNEIPLVRALELQIAGRMDRYTVRSAGTVNLLAATPAPVTYFENTLHSIDPTLGLRYQPVKGLTFRASYGTGFLPPSVSQVSPGAPSVQSAVTNANQRLSDPRRGNEALGAVTLSTGGNSNLNPEKSESRSAGFVVNPSEIPNLRVSVDWTRINKVDNITTLPFNQTNILNEAVVADLVVRGPVPANDPYGVGRIVGFNAALRNIAAAKIEAYDFAVDYAKEVAGWGEFGFTGIATRLMHVQTQLVETSPVIENVGVGTAQVSTGNTGGGLRWKANATLSWKRGDWAAGWTARYFDSYFLNLAHTVVASQGSATVPTQTYHDIYLSWSAPANGVPAVLEKTQVSFGVVNIFNTKPPVDVLGTTGVNPGGYSMWGDPRLATYYLSVRKAF
jgi:iron complex outermembrane receptor protein